MDNEQLSNLRHSCAHLLAAAVLDLYPGAKNAIGPSIENGFYQDFDLGDHKISEEDFPKIEEKMCQIVKTWEDFKVKEVAVDLARKDFSWNPYKLELIEEFAKEGKKITENNPGNFLDLCKGGHSGSPKEQLKHFKLLSVAGAYWRGDEKNKMLTRIYGTAFPTKEELDTHLSQLEEAKKRDHRKLGRELDLFIVSPEVGGGLPIFTPKGTIIRDQIESYLTKLKKDHGYQFVWSPHIANSQIYHTSGHWGKYDAMFAPMKLEDEEYVLKPMNCPHHFQVYLNRPRSYRDLPIRIAENGTVYRYEKSGELNGLLRVRSLTIDDTHTFIRSDQTFDELHSVLTLIKKILEQFGFSDYIARISTSDKNNPDKYLGKPEEWDQAETALKKASEKAGFSFIVGEGEAAFYGPKIDVLVKDSLSRQWQLSTVQLDYNQPHNFEMTYIDETGQKAYPAILHIAMIGSMERLIGILIEHYAGAFPVWLSPVQVAILPVTDKVNNYAQKIYNELLQHDIRTTLNEDSKPLGAKIRESTLQKIPYLCIIGERELEYHETKKKTCVTVRTRDGRDLKLIEVSKFVDILRDDIENKQ